MKNTQLMNIFYSVKYFEIRAIILLIGALTQNNYGKTQESNLKLEQVLRQEKIPPKEPKKQKRLRPGQLLYLPERISVTIEYKLESIPPGTVKKKNFKKSPQGSRHQTPDTVDDRVRDLPPRQQHQYQSGPPPQSRGHNQPPRRDNRRDERRRMTDEEDTVLDSQDVSSIDRDIDIIKSGNIR
uniref:(California timema) hypothetical protein n=1 Tax=Timema californicum TaxID=61474 RepID=A0A7R9IZ14_TIMCA|nr:unnamed protein product [Timema californicum]